MKANVYSINGNKEEEIELPYIFNTIYRPDLIHKAFVHIQTLKFQPKGTDPLAGERTSAESRNTGLGIARLARVKGSGFPRAGQAAGVSGVVKGRATHPPTSEKIIIKRLNKKEKRLALASAIAVTAVKEIVVNRGHILSNSIELPIIISNEIEKINKTKDLINVLTSLGLKDDLERVRSRIKRRTGVARRRGRAKRVGKSALIVVKDDTNLKRAGGSIPGIDIVRVDRLSILHLAPGSNAGRLTIWSKNSLEYLNNMNIRLLEVSKVIAQ